MIMITMAIQKTKKEVMMSRVKKLFIALEGTEKFVAESLDMSPIVSAIQLGITEGVTDAYSSIEEENVVEVTFKITDHTKGGNDGK